jgi:hypothetical protein
MHDTQTVAVLVMCALEFEYQLALGLGNSDSSSTLANEVMLPHVCARNYNWLEEIEVVSFPNVSGLHVLSCLVHESLCFVLTIFDNLNSINCAFLSGCVLCNNIPRISILRCLHTPSTAVSCQQQ